MKRLSQAELEEIRRGPQNIDPHRFVKALSELISRHYGYDVELVLTPKGDGG